MSTKRSPAERPAKTKHVREDVAQKPQQSSNSVEAATVHPLRAPVNDPNHAPSYFEPKDVTRTHELIADAVTEMLTVGGHTEDVDGLIYAAMAHTRRRWARTDTEEKTDAHIREFVNSDFTKWKTDVLITWRKNRMPDPPHVEPKSITDRIRANFRQTLRGQFENFLNSSSPEEQRFLVNVLASWDGRHHFPEHRSDEIFLGYAFEAELDRNDVSYLRVPEHLVDRVQKYIDALRAIDDKEVA